jgi:hypothetical protein
MAAKSYAWSARLSAVVEPGAEVVVPTPGFDNPENYHADQAQVGLDGNVLIAEQFSLAWADDHSEATVTNGTEAEWQPTQTIYVTVAGIPFDAENVEDTFSALEDRVSATETQVDDHETRITALEGAGGATLTRVETEKGSVTRAQDNDETHHDAEREETKSKRNEKSSHSRAKAVKAEPVKVAPAKTKPKAKPGKKPRRW